MNFFSHLNSKYRSADINTFVVHRVIYCSVKNIQNTHRVKNATKIIIICKLVEKVCFSATTKSVFRWLNFYSWIGQDCKHARINEHIEHDMVVPYGSPYHILIHIRGVFQETWSLSVIFQIRTIYIYRCAQIHIWICFHWQHLVFHC